MVSSSSPTFTPGEINFSPVKDIDEYYAPGSGNIDGPCGVYKNPLIRDGLSQPERLLEALDFSYAQIDERKIVDLIHYTHQYAERVRYYNPDNSPNGDWVPFIENDISTTISIISLYDTNAQRVAFEAVLNLIYGVHTNAPKQAIFKSYFSFIANILKLTDNWYLKSIPGYKLNTDLAGMIKGQLSASLKQLIAYDKGASVFFNFPDTPYSAFNYAQFSEIWGIGDINSIEADLSIYGVASDTNEEPEDLSTPLQEIFIGNFKAATHEAAPVLISLLSSVLSKIELLKANGASYMDEALNTYPEHEPHFALYLTFLKLFGFAQEHLNELSQKHLDFYYRDVLRLSEKAAIPDEVFVIFELAKNFDEDLLLSNTQLKAGKDAIGKNLFYALKNDIVVNQATIAEFKTLKIPTEVPNSPTLFKAAPIANSLDGLGTDKGIASWKPFGNDASPAIEVGLAVASPQLFLKEGLRKVTLSFPLASTFPSAGNSPVSVPGIGIQVSGPTGWIDIDKNNVHANIVKNPVAPGNGILVVNFPIQQAQAAVVAYNTKIHGGTLVTQWPVVKVLTDVSPYVDQLKDLELTGYEIKVEVGTIGTGNELLNLQGINSLVIQNDEGLLDSTKPFKPFTAKPKIGSTFYIGNDEIFQKKLTSLDIFVEWLGAPVNLQDYYSGYVKPPVPPSTITHPAPSNTDYKVKVKLLDNFIWKNVIRKPQNEPAFGITDEVAGLPGTLGTPLGTPGIPGFSPNPNEPVIQPGTSHNASLGFNSGHEVKSHSSVSSVKSFNPSEYRSAEFLGGFNIVFSALSTPINSAEIFDATNAQVPVLINLDTKELQNGVQINYFDSERDPYQAPVTQYKAGLKRGFLKLELSSHDFQHAAYPNLYAEAAMKKGNSTVATTTPGSGGTETTTQSSSGASITFPNEPYTPVIKQISLLYTSSAGSAISEFTTGFDIDALRSDYEDRIEQIFHLYPFGSTEIFPVKVSGTRPEFSMEGINVTSKLFPQFPYSGSDEVVTAGTEDQVLPPEGNLYIGIKDLVPPQTLSMLFQFAGDTGNPGVQLPVVKWSYLSNNRWVPFKNDHIVSDDTEGFLKSGIIAFDVPADATNTNTELPTGYHWIKASTPKERKLDTVAIPPVAPSNIEVFNNLVNVHTQAAIAVFQETDNDPDHLRKPLLPLTINKLVNRDFSIKTVTQPYSSFGGKVAEQQTDFYIRVSERLRHKNKAITLNDYERIVLENFPTIYRVRCINVKDASSELSPGSVTTVVIPNIAPGVRVENAFVLKAGLTARNEIKNLLKQCVTPFVKLAVIDPFYETVQAKFDVKFLPGFDATFYANKLNDELKGFISPWGYGDIDSIHFGGKVIGSEVINFIEERPYVDYVDNFSLNQAFTNDSGTLPVWEKTNIVNAVAATAVSILVTVENHLISSI